MLRWAGLVIVAVALVSGCSGQVESTPGVVPSPTAAVPSAPVTATPFESDRVILRMSQEPTMMPYPGATVEPPHPFTLYADGLAIYNDFESATELGQRVALRQAQLSEEQVAELLSFAANEAGLAEAGPNYPGSRLYVTDGDNTIFEIHGAGLDKRVLVYGPGLGDPADPHAAIRKRMGLLSDRLWNFADEVANGEAQDLGEYEPEAYRVTLDQPLPESHLIRKEWPWPGLHPSDFLTVQAVQGRARQLSAEQVLAIADNPLDAPNDLAVKGPDYFTYLVRIRALLPDEVVPTT